jgi:hypothetical protein
MGNGISLLASHNLRQKKNGSGDAESLQSQSFCALCSFSVSIMSL